MAIITLDDQAQNSIIVCPGANRCVTASETVETLERLPNLKIIMMQLEIPISCVEQTIDYANKHKIITFLDPAPVPQEGLSDATYKMLDYISPNAIEAEMLSGIPVSDMDSARKAAGFFLKKGVKNVIILLSIPLQREIPLRALFAQGLKREIGFLMRSVMQIMQAVCLWRGKEPRSLCPLQKKLINLCSTEQKGKKKHECL